MAAPIRLTFHGTILVAVFVVLILMAAAPARQAYEQKQAVAREKARLEALKTENRSLEQRLARLNDPEYQEKLAREQLGLVRPGETSYVVVPGPTPTQTVTADEPANRAWHEKLASWFKKLFD
ncbi:MAG: septum formation initiator family protein [Actinobacteria bacterium]|nr:septum formation initiator family protein [Actinomycetota bacterium]